LNPATENELFEWVLQQYPTRQRAQNHNGGHRNKFAPEHEKRR
jgi:hypothetical protein